MRFNTRPIRDTSLQLPTLGFGAAPLGGLFNGVDDAQAADTLATAFKSGLRYVDTAPFYGFGLSERRVGDVLRGQDYVLSTKVGRLLHPGAAPDPASLGWPEALPFHPVFDYSYDGIMRSFEASLQRLGLARIDILYVHDIGPETHGAGNAQYFEALEKSGYRALEDLRRDGRVQAIGIGVNETQVCADALEIGDWDVFLLAGRYTLLEQTPLDGLFAKCARHKVSVVVGGPFNSGVLVGGDTWNYGAVPEAVRARVTQLSQLCQAFQVPLAAAALQFPLGHDVVVSVIPGLRNLQELSDTLEWAACDIPDAFWQALKDRNLLHPDAPTPTGAPFLEMRA
ncbi:aldo/keto reductase [Pseudosulfitobacter sp. DSM 107133]|uniref:aldo/keto reductase n=1 Tax=Pseudosulfitobacter sp. DSM 107133 TaxID=2883100 RepID=UPI000DF28235|nr:aldo/keto reductase [Pseudosulfitobacter sp. DSM 107133]UOA29143.1 Pyridoxal 4-dehydrogenase [Pseudosulfitobacter sp. DSM 107133]